MSELLTEERLAEMFSMKKSTLARLRRQQNVPHIRIGKLIRYSRDEVEEWLNRCHGSDATTIRKCNDE